MSTPLISIIIPTFNRAHLIGETLDSLIGQSYTNWECIIVDDGSTDNTHSLIESYSRKNPKIKFYKRPDQLRKGANSCRNYGFGKCSGNWIKWFDSDDLFLDDALAKTIPFLNDENDVVVTQLAFVDENKMPLPRMHSIVSQNTIADYLVGKIAFYTITPTWKRSFLEKQTQLFDPEIGNLDDWDFNLRMIYQNPKTAYIEEVLIHYRASSNSLSQELEKLNLTEINSEFRAREKHLRILREMSHPAAPILQNYIKKRSSYFFRSAVLKNDKSKYYLLKKLLSYQSKSADVFGMSRTLFGFTFFSIFKKGYTLLK